jgi:hypothetical protein
MAVTSQSPLAITAAAWAVAERSLPAYSHPCSPKKGRYRRLMQVQFNPDAYRQRAQAETVISMIKRRQGAHVAARSPRLQHRELRLMALTRNVMILLCG